MPLLPPLQHLLLLPLRLPISTNVPVFTDGQRILDAIQRLITTVTSIDDLRTELRKEFDSLKSRMTSE